MLALSAGASAHVQGSPTRDRAKAKEAGGPTFVVSGRGWGHGVGMSQYGALGFARRGYSYTRILSHYYPGTQLAKSDPAQIRVLLAEKRAKVTVISEAPFRLRDGEGKLRPLRPGRLDLGPGLRVKLKAEGKPIPLPGPLTFLPGSLPLRLEVRGKPIRAYRGWLQVSSNGKALEVVNHVGLEQYLYGVVPDEVPDTWPPEALKAQAVAARSYAVATRKSGAFDVYADTRSQVYGGVGAETFPASAAVDATAGQIVTYKGRVAITYFFSTSGGRTAAIEDAWPGSRPVPYLVSVADPYDSLSPHHRWGPVAFTRGTAGSKLGIRKGLSDLTTVVNRSGRVSSVVATTPVGRVELRAGDVRRMLGLRSTWFTIGVLSLTPPSAPALWGTGAKLAGIARGVSGVSLQQGVTAGVWEPASPVVAGKDGAFSVLVKPQATTTYRLASAGKIASGTVRVSVAPLVRFSLAEGGTILRGTVRPIYPGTPVDIQRLDGNTWKLFEQARLEGRGFFQGALRPPPGTYRARVAPGHGLVPGVTPVLKVVSA